MSTPLASRPGGAYRATPSANTVPVDSPRTRGPLSRAKIVAAAVEVIDTGGVNALTMRSVSSRLGVEAMALYRYVQSRDDLLDAVADHLIDHLDDDPDLAAAAPTWQVYLVRLAHAVRRTVRAHPRIFPLIATRPTAAPWIRPPLRTLRWVDSFLKTLLRHHFSEAAAVSAYRSFCSFLLGELLTAIRAQTGPDHPGHAVPDQPDDLTGQPLLQRLLTELHQDHSADEFNAALAALLNRLHGTRSTRVRRYESRTPPRPKPGSRRTRTTGAATGALSPIRSRAVAPQP
jgi:AcrR family transcriptional regulator